MVSADPGAVASFGAERIPRVAMTPGSGDQHQPAGGGHARDDPEVASLLPSCRSGGIPSGGKGGWYLLF